MPTTSFRFALLVATSLQLAACATSGEGAPPPTADAARTDASLADASALAPDVAPPEDALDAVALLDVPPSDVVTPMAADARAPDAAEAGDAPAPSDQPTDAPSTETAVVTYVRDIQPILRTTCNGCHDGDAGTAAPFVESYAVTQRPSLAGDPYGCPGELIGECINRGAQAQRLEGTHCRTYVRPFHREGFNRCITESEQALIMAWVVGGMIER